MKKGLRLVGVCRLPRMRFSDRRPDEEGIKTRKRGRLRFLFSFQTADLMKKGLRLQFATHRLPPGIVSDRRPDEEGIKTSFCVPVFRSRAISDRRPDEEGIKTGLQPLLAIHEHFRPQT